MSIVAIEMRGCAFSLQWTLPRTNVNSESKISDEARENQPAERVTATAIEKSTARGAAGSIKPGVERQRNPRIINPTTCRARGAVDRGRGLRIIIC